MGVQVGADLKGALPEIPAESTKVWAMGLQLAGSEALSGKTEQKLSVV